jgi:hypothetical protein
VFTHPEDGEWHDKTLEEHNRLLCSEIENTARPSSYKSVICSSLNAILHNLVYRAAPTSPLHQIDRTLPLPAASLLSYLLFFTPTWHCSTIETNHKIAGADLPLGRVVTTTMPAIQLLKCPPRLYKMEATMP